MSHVSGDTSIPLIESSVAAAWGHQVAVSPHAPCLASDDQGINWSYAEVDLRAEEFARGLVARCDVQPGDRVGTLSVCAVCVPRVCVCVRVCVRVCVCVC